MPVKLNTPSYTLEDYHRLDMLDTQDALQEERAVLLKLDNQHASHLASRVRDREQR
jgi:hypothetical protein